MTPSNNTSSFQQETNGSTTRTSSSRCFAYDSDTVKALRVAGYSVLILVSLLGNSLVVAVVYRNKKMRKTTNIFIANMAVADLIITIVYMPRSIAMYLIGTAWVEGTVGLILCKIVPFLHGVSLLVSILTLLLISIERLCTILLPLRFTFTPKMTKIATAAVWVVAVLARLPYILALRLAIYSRSGRTVCSSELKNFFGKAEARDIYYWTLLVVFYALPLVLIIVSYLVIINYLRRRRAPGSTLTLKERQVNAVLRMMIVVTFAFIACWITYFVALIVFSKIPCAVRFWRLFLAHSNSALNPCLYVLFNRTFRRDFVNIIVEIFTFHATSRKRAGERTRPKHRALSPKEEGVKMEMIDIGPEEILHPNNQ